MRGHPLHGLDRGPPNQPGALLICGTRVVKLRGTRAQLVFLLFFGARRGRRGGVGVQARASARPRSGRRAWTSGPVWRILAGFGEERGKGQRWLMIAPVGVGLCPRFTGVRRAPLHIWVLGPKSVRRHDGDQGVSTGAAAHCWSAVQHEGRQQQGCWELAAGSSVVGRGTRTSGSADSGGSEPVRPRGRGPGRRGCAGCGGSGGRACGPSTAARVARRGGI